MYNLALFSSINFVPYERKFTQKESFQTTYVCRTSMQKTINCVIPKRLFGLLLNCWLETQNTVAVLAKTIIIPKIWVFLQIFVVISPLIKSGWIIKIQIFPFFDTPAPLGGTELFNTYKDKMKGGGELGPQNVDFWTGWEGLGLKNGKIRSS